MSDSWSPDESPENEAYEAWDEALDEEDELQPDAPGDPEGERALDRHCVDEEELSEIGAELDDPEQLAVLEGGIDDRTGSARSARANRPMMRDGTWTRRNAERTWTSMTTRADGMRGGRRAPSRRRRLMLVAGRKPRPSCEGALRWRPWSVVRGPGCGGTGSPPGCVTGTSLPAGSMPVRFGSGSRTRSHLREAGAAARRPVRTSSRPVCSMSCPCCGTTPRAFRRRR